MAGCHVATVTQIIGIYDNISTNTDAHDHVRSFEEIFLSMRKLLRNVQESPLVDLGWHKETICRAIWGPWLEHVFEANALEQVHLGQLLEYVSEIIDFPERDPPRLSLAHANILSRFNHSSIGRSLSFTEEGYLGLVPQASQSNDIIVIILGCGSPLVLRPIANQRYLVVGECYFYHIARGDTLLGQMPENWQFVSRFDEETGKNWFGFENQGWRSWQIDDPRLGPLPHGWFKAEHPQQHVWNLFRNESEDITTSRDPRMLPESLRARGVQIQEFDLV